MDYESNRDFSEFSGISTNLIKEHFHRSIELIYCVKKDRLCVVNGQNLTLKMGELLIVPPFFLREYDNDGVGFCHVLPVEYSDLWDKYTHSKSIDNHIITNKDLAKELFDHLNTAVTAKNKLLKTASYEYVLGKIFAECCFTSTDHHAIPNFTKDVVNYIEKNFSTDITLDLVAKHFGYSKYYFSNLFNKYFKINFKTYLNNVRISKAKAMLKRHTISEVSDACGYNSLQSFFLNFKKITGVTPGEYVSNKN